MGWVGHQDSRRWWLCCAWSGLSSSNAGITPCLYPSPAAFVQVVTPCCLQEWCLFSFTFSRFTCFALHCCTGHHLRWGQLPRDARLEGSQNRVSTVVRECTASGKVASPSPPPPTHTCRHEHWQCRMHNQGPLAVPPLAEHPALVLVVIFPSESLAPWHAAVQVASESGPNPTPCLPGFPRCC